MNVEYSNRAVADLHEASAESLAFGEAVAAALEMRIRNTIARVSEHPEAAQRVDVVPLIRYPYKIFYRVLDDHVRILRIRHTSRGPWSGG
jgi:toxin ParE1/3/4